MPRIHVDDEVYEELTRYARHWGQSAGEAVATLVRLIVQSVHAVEPPPTGPCGGTDTDRIDDTCEGQP